MPGTLINRPLQLATQLDPDGGPLLSYTLFYSRVIHLNLMQRNLMHSKFFVYADENSQWATKTCGIFRLAQGGKRKKKKRHFCLAILGEIAQAADAH